MTEKILVMLPNNLGDVLMACPVVEALKNKYPDSHITFFVEEGFEGGLENSRFCDRIFRFNRKAIRNAARTRDWQKALDALRETVASLGGFDRVINLSQHPYVAFVVSLLSCKDTVGQEFLRAGNHAVNDKWSQYLYAIPFARRYNRLHATDIYRKIAGAGLANQRSCEPVTFLDEERAAAEKFLTDQGRSAIGWDHTKPIMILQPGAAIASKRWPIEHFIALGKLLVGDGYRIVVTGAPAEVDLAKALAAQLKTATIVTAGLISFRQTIAILPSVQGCVTGDTAIMHAAALLGRRVYALFGSTSPVETGPYGEGHCVFAGRCTNRPCFCAECKTHLCMRSILPEDVHAVIQGLSYANAHCDIYRTSFDTSGLFTCKPVLQKGVPYYDTDGAEISRRIVEPEYIPQVTEKSLDLIRESDRFCEALDSLSTDLLEYAQQHDPAAIRRYEEARKNLSGEDINGFWSAMLNLRLNSVPLIDAEAAVRKSIEICMTTKSDIKDATTFA
ncbi:MAG: hypothetical protein MUF22_10045 [Chitinispirillaceae bacterium]|jgi:ADP-heptose:LPS heptosyltransferase|nr:hypothetical protein [Chitinispirillaceae bacterium]